jgi:hypothetical protein
MKRPALFMVVLVLAASLTLAAQILAQTDPLPSWNEGAAKKAIVEFVQATTTQGGPNFVPAPERIATFDQDDTLWVEHPMMESAFSPQNFRSEVIWNPLALGDAAIENDDAPRFPFHCHPRFPPAPDAHDATAGGNPYLVERRRL